MSRSKHARRRAARPHHHVVLRVILASQLCLALLTGLTVVLVYHHLDGNLQTEDLGARVTVDPKKVAVSGPREPLNILVMGSDSRDGAGNDIDGQKGGGERSDTTILLHVSADRKEAYGVSIPRDTLVTRPDCKAKDGSDIPGADLQMFNSAFSAGGAACTISTVGAITGIHIDHWVVVDFRGFRDMVDAVGGVQVCIPRPVDDREHGIVFDAGTQVLKGEQALDYVRERYVLSTNSDIGRMKRQQAFIASMINKVFSAGTLARPDRIYNFLDAAIGSLRLDQGLGSLGRLVDLAQQFGATGLGDIRFVTVPFEAYKPDPNRLVLAPEAADLWKRIRLDQPLGSEFSSGSINAAAPPGGTASGSASPGTSSSPSASPSASPSGSPSASPGQSPSASPSDSAQAQENLANGLCA